MSKVRSKNTSLEQLVFKRLTRDGIYFQRHYRKVKGAPDIALPSKKIAVFIDGNFWHGWHYDSFKRKLPPYWKKKIAGNMARDRRTRTKLRRSGWKILRVWEHQLKRKKEATLIKVEMFLESKKQDPTID